VYLVALPTARRSDPALVAAGSSHPSSAAVLATTPKQSGMLAIAIVAGIMARWYRHLRRGSTAQRKGRGDLTIDGS
jgi:hypothetical protein